MLPKIYKTKIGIFILIRESRLHQRRQSRDQTSSASTYKYVIKVICRTQYPTAIVTTVAESELKQDMVTNYAIDITRELLFPIHSNTYDDTTQLTWPPTAKAKSVCVWTSVESNTIKH